MIDYAYPTMMAEKALKDLHNAMLSRRYDQAIEHGLTTITETVRAIEAIRKEMGKTSGKVGEISPKGAS